MKASPGIVIACASLMAGAIAAGAAAAAEATAAVAGDQALRQLLAGNRRYVAARLTHPHQTALYRARVARGQHPFAIVVGCSDSRVPAEIVFDQGLGDLFVIRVAGNVVDDTALGSIEYAAEHLGVGLIVVLGHERCGAVDAAVKGGTVHGHIDSLVKAIAPAVEQVKNRPGDVLDHAVRANAAMTAGRLRTAPPILADLAAGGRLKIVGARYDLDSGAVEILRP
jgi:carbonic anhydrase